MGAPVQLTEPTAPAPGGEQEPSGSAAASAHPLPDLAEFVLVIAGRVYRAMLLTLLAVAVLPMLWSWSSHVIRSGSMEPALGVGDVVVAKPFAGAEKVPVGRVMLFDPPPGSGGDDSQRIHRVVEKLPDGRFRTRGDANSAPDVEPVRRHHLDARPLLLVRYVGLPVHWLSERDFVPLSLWLVVSGVLLGYSFRRLGGEEPRGGSGGRRLGWSGGRRRPLETPPGRRARRGILAMIGLVGLVLTLPESASAAFTGRTSTGSNTWRTAADLEQRYTAAVSTDRPWAFYRLDEPSGTAAADSAGGNRTGSYTAVAAYGETGALPGNPGYATRYAGGTGRMVGGGSALSDPTTFSVELWFKTTSTAGGKLFGFENTRNQTSSAYDREAVLRTDGRVTYVGGASTSKVLTSPTALNDGRWHHLVVTSVPAGGSNQSSALYVDGAPAASGTTSKAAFAYAGWWRIGYGQIPIGIAFPLTGNLSATIDDVAIYTTQLSAARVAAHYAAR